MATFQHLHNHSNKPNLDTIDQDLGTADTPTFDQLTITTSGTVNGQALEHSNRANLDTIDQNLATSDSVNFDVVTSTNFRIDKEANGQANWTSQTCGGTLASPTDVPDGTNIGRFVFNAHDGASYVLMSDIFGYKIDDSTGRLYFRTRASASINNRLSIEGNAIYWPALKSGASQALAGAAANEMYRLTTDNTLRLGV